MLKVYFDNDVASAVSRRDLNEAELRAIDQLLELHRSRRIVIGISRQSSREMERAPFPYQSNLKAGLSGLQRAEVDHVVLGFHTQTDPYGGFISGPLVTDIVDKPLFLELREKIGLEDDDAKHLMYAVHNGYARFLTCDSHFLTRRTAIERRCPSIRIQKPSELAADLPAINDGSEVDPTLASDGA